MQNKNVLKDFIVLINAIIKRPGMFMVNNVENLGLVIFGFKCACNDANRELLDNLLDGFKKNVNERFETKEDSDWVRLIRFYGVGDNNTLQLFELAFDSFISSNYSDFLEEGAA